MVGNLGLCIYGANPIRYMHQNSQSFDFFFIGFDHIQQDISLILYIIYNIFVLFEVRETTQITMSFRFDIFTSMYDFFEFIKIKSKQFFLLISLRTGFQWFHPCARALIILLVHPHRVLYEKMSSQVFVKTYIYDHVD